MVVKLETLSRRFAGLAPAHAPLREADILAFERRHAIELPEQYRQCLLHVCNGAPTGLFRLGEADSGWDFVPWQEGDGFVGRLADPFPHQAEWNDLSGMPSDELDENDAEACARWEQEREAFEARYWGPLDGALPIAHIGCAIRHWLIVTGPQRGYVWEDDRAHYQGLYPYLGEDDAPVDFLQYLDWQTSPEPAP